MIACHDPRVLQRIGDAPRLWFFLDYDGTLADFAATPDEIIPDAQLIALVDQLAALPGVRVTIISGRRLAHIQSLIPLPQLLKAGTYGLEIETPQGETIHRVDYDVIRPLLDDLKQDWQGLLAERAGFFLEDKGWTLAIHGKDATEEAAAAIFKQAQVQAKTLLEKEPANLFRLQGGHRFLECGPQAADKKNTVRYILSTFPGEEDALLIYLGDDDKDEIAFEAIQENAGLVVAVGNRLRQSAADCWLASPQAVRHWLQMVVALRKKEIFPKDS